MKNENIIIDVSNILSQKETGYLQEENINFIIDNVFDEIKISKPVIGKAKIVKIDDGLIVKFNLQTAVKTNCSRCLKNNDLQIEIRNSTEFSYSKTHSDHIIINNKTIDVWPAIREQIILSLPMKFLCSDKCKGIKY